MTKKKKTILSPSAKGSNVAKGMQISGLITLLDGPTTLTYHSCREHHFEKPSLSRVAR